MPASILAALSSLWRRVSPASFGTAAVCAAFSAVAVDDAAPRTEDDLLRLTEPLLARIEVEEARGGPFSRDLIELLTSLGLAYQEHGEHALAAAVLDRALFLLRFNEGLHGFEQVPLMQRLIDSERALGGNAEQLEDRLLELARRSPADPRAAPIFRGAAERELDYYERYLRGEIPAVLSFNDPDPVARAASTSLWRARRHYHEALGALGRDPREHHAELAELEQGLTRTYYLEAQQRGRWYFGVDDPLFGLGLTSYERRVGYTRAASPAVVDYARALIELADWSLLFSRNGMAVNRYREAYDLLVERRASPATIEAFFPRDIPVFVPTFVRPPLDDAAAAGLVGHVDVDFEITKYGRPRKVSVVATSGDGAALSKDVFAAIRRSRYRPSPMAAEPAEYRLRYSLVDGSLTPRP